MVTDHMLVPRFRAIWRRWRRGAALRGPYLVSTERNRALSHQRKLAVEAARRETAAAVAFALEARANVLRSRVVQSVSRQPNHDGPVKSTYSQPKHEEDSRMTSKIQSVNRRKQQDKPLTSAGRVSSSQHASSQHASPGRGAKEQNFGQTREGLRADICWPVVSPQTAVPQVQEPHFIPSLPQNTNGNTLSGETGNQRISKAMETNKRLDLQPSPLSVKPSPTRSYSQALRRLPEGETAAKMKESSSKGMEKLKHEKHAGGSSSNRFADTKNNKSAVKNHKKAAEKGLWLNMVDSGDKHSMHTEGAGVKRMLYDEQQSETVCSSSAVTSMSKERILEEKYLQPPEQTSTKKDIKQGSESIHGNRGKLTTVTSHAVKSRAADRHQFAGLHHIAGPTSLNTQRHYGISKMEQTSMDHGQQSKSHKKETYLQNKLHQSTVSNQLSRSGQQQESDLGNNQQLARMQYPPSPPPLMQWQRINSDSFPQVIQADAQPTPVLFTVQQEMDLPFFF